MKFKVESDVPLAVPVRGRKPTYFPFEQMGVGDSFLIECDTDDKKEVENWRRKLVVAKKRYLLEAEHDGTPPSWKTGLVAGGLRVWRVN
jgi:hypothetical protein